MDPLATLFARHGGASDSGMDDMEPMSSSSSSSSTGMNMAFHAGGGDVLWSTSFVPKSAGAIFGAAVLLFFLAAFTRFLHALERSLALRWFAGVSPRRAPLVGTHHLAKGALTLVNGGILYLLMIAVMTMNVYYFTAILLGLGLGDVVFGRFGYPYQQQPPAASPLAPQRAQTSSDDGSHDADLDKHRHHAQPAQ